MDFKSCDAAELTPLRYSMSEVGKYNCRAQKILARMKEAASDHYANDWGVSIELSEEGASISTPFGEARARIRPIYSRDQVHAVIWFDKQELDNHDQLSWRPVWKIRLLGNNVFSYDDDQPVGYFGSSDYFYDALVLNVLRYVAQE